MKGRKWFIAEEAAQTLLSILSSFCLKLLYMRMATTITLPTYPRSVKLLSSECASYRVMSLGLYAMSYRPTSSFGQKLSSHCCIFCVPEPPLIKNFKRISWSIRSSVDNSEVDPSPTNGTTGTTRLIRVIQALQSRLGTRIGEIRRGLPVKILFFLVGFYCSTCYATVIGQTGDWDILSAAFAVLIVEGIGALMYKASLPLLKKTKSLITKFNYWKAGLAMAKDEMIYGAIGWKPFSYVGTCCSLQPVLRFDGLAFEATGLLLINPPPPSTDRLRP